MKTVSSSHSFFFFLFFSILIGKDLFGQQRWNIQTKTSIKWSLDTTTKLPHTDNIEIAGKRVAGIITYAIDTNKVISVNREIFFPQLHPFIKETDPNWYIYRSYLKDIYSDGILPKLFIGDKQITLGPIKEITINGFLNLEHQPSKSGISVHRKLFPSPTKRQFIEQITLINTTNKVLDLKATNTHLQYETYGTEGKFTTLIQSNAPLYQSLNPGEEVSFSLNIIAKKEKENFPNLADENDVIERVSFLDKMRSSLVLETPNPVLNTLFEFSKIRASESIFESKLGLIHSPGGGRYYVGIWANDQAEYISPFFPYLGYDIGNESALNTYRAFAKKTNKEFHKIQYAFEIEGTVPPFLLDRGDAAMIAYGASQYALALGDKKIAHELWPLISWCLEYCNRQLNKEGVVQSESDEMEGRIETGTANLSTSSLYYGALKHAVNLGKSLHKPHNIIKKYTKQATLLYDAIENYFGANIEGLHTYKYYKEHQYLRHWISLPLVVGINKRKDATVTALFDRLWSENGVHVEKNSTNKEVSDIFWDRGTLYALRGTFFSGATNTSLEKLEEFSEKRLLGERVPYVVEAFPEGNMAHLSAESGLYCRVFTEGLFGIIPTGLNSFEMIPRLPDHWNKMSLRKIKAFGQNFDIEVSRKNKLINIKIIDLKNSKIVFDQNTKLQKPISFSFNQ